jgi:hypothetical protein
MSSICGHRKKRLKGARNVTRLATVATCINLLVSDHVKVSLVYLPPENIAKAPMSDVAMTKFSKDIIKHPSMTNPKLCPPG